MDPLSLKEEYVVLFKEVKDSLALKSSRTDIIYLLFICYNYLFNNLLH